MTTEEGCWHASGAVTDYGYFPQGSPGAARVAAVSKESHLLLSCGDIVELLDHYRPRRQRDEEEFHGQIKKRHAARQRDIK